MLLKAKNSKTENISTFLNDSEVLKPLEDFIRLSEDSYDNLLLTSRLLSPVRYNKE